MSSIPQTSPPGTAGAARGARHVNLRAFLAGSAATTALIAGAVVVFAALATYVAFNGLPGGGEGADSNATVLVGSNAPAAPEAVAAVFAAAPAAVAPAPPASAPAPAPATAQPAPPGTSPAEPPAGDDTSVGTGGVTGTGEPSAGGPATPAEQNGPLGGAVNDLDDAAGNLGVDSGLGNTTQPLTSALDNAINETLNNAGDLLGNPHLGDRVGQGLTDTTNNLLGEGGLTDQLLAPKP